MKNNKLKNKIKKIIKEQPTADRATPVRTDSDGSKKGDGLGNYKDPIPDKTIPVLIERAPEQATWRIIEVLEVGLGNKTILDQGNCSSDFQYQSIAIGSGGSPLFSKGKIQPGTDVTFTQGKNKYKPEKGKRR